MRNMGSGTIEKKKKKKAKKIYRNSNDLHICNIYSIRQPSHTNGNNRKKKSKRKKKQKKNVKFTDQMVHMNI